MNKKFAALIIMDGYGLAPDSPSNPVSLAKKPFIDSLLRDYPNNTLEASGEAVGLPDGQMGNSEVGHLNLGAGRVVYQSLTRINKSIKDKDFFTNKSFLNAIEYAKKHNSNLHILGLASDGGVHSYTTHIKALIKLAIDNGLKDRTYFHAFLDGRDTPQNSGLGYMEDLIRNGANVATVSGRYFAMDRDNNWDRIQKSFDIITTGSATEKDALKTIKENYDNNITDEFIEPFLVNKNGIIRDNDAVIFANFRPDRAIRIATALSNPSASIEYHTDGKADLDIKNAPKNIFFVSMMHYNKSVTGEIAYPLQKLDNIYGEVIAKNNLNQLRIAETEKYAHVTFFFDGGAEKDLTGSSRILVQSPNVATYDLKPEMSAFEIRDKAVEAIKSLKFDTMILNFANPDMVGHTGSIEATKIAVETVDTCVKDVVDAILSIGGVAIVLADHGNAEKMRDETGGLHTAHTTNLVPVVITKKGITIRDNGALCDIAPTLLDLLDIKQPTEMTGKSLIKK